MREGTRDDRPTRLALANSLHLDRGADSSSGRTATADREVAAKSSPYSGRRGTIAVGVDNRTDREMDLRLVRVCGATYSDDRRGRRERRVPSFTPARHATERRTDRRAASASAMAVTAEAGEDPNAVVRPPPLAIRAPSTRSPSSPSNPTRRDHAEVEAARRARRRPVRHDERRDTARDRTWRSRARACARREAPNTRCSASQARARERT